MTSSPHNPRTVDLPWDKSADYPRRLLSLDPKSKPPKNPKHLLAYGGGVDVDSGLALLLSLSSDSTVVVVRSYDDDEIRAVAVSMDGRRVAVGLDSGALHLYAYPDYDAARDAHHPFVVVHETDDTDHSNQNSNTANCFAGPYQNASIRDLQFRPDSYVLCVATEAGMTFMDADSATTIVAVTAASQKYYSDFTMEVAKHHNASGIRSCLYWPRATPTAIATSVDGDDEASQQQQLLSSLAMDGRHCLWHTNNTDARHLVHRETSCCITKKDVGEILGADVWDRSCRMAAATLHDGTHVLGLPGEPTLQLRVWRDGALIECNEAGGDGAGGAAGGHVEPIVVVATHPSKTKFWVTSGRDGRVILWHVRLNRVRNELCTVVDVVCQSRNDL
jgi:hypothetical protein